MQHKSHPTLKSLFHNGELHTNAWIINNKIGLAIKYSTTPKSQNGGNMFSYGFLESDPLLKFSNKLDLYVAFFGINNSINAKSHYISYLKITRDVYRKALHPTKSVTLFVRKDYSPKITFMHPNESEPIIQSWNSFPDILFK
jgi:hypothetical protein